LSASLTPHGVVSVATDEVDGLFSTPNRAVKAILGAFERGSGYGLLHLGASEVGTDVGPSVAYWRELGHRFVTATCAALNPTAPDEVVSGDAAGADLDELARSAPPMLGAEFINADVLRSLWGSMASALAEHARKRTVAEFFQACHPSWNVAGRVCLHLAENKGDTDYPFAFIATYARQIPGRGQLQYVPLGRALQEFSGAGNKSKLLTLLTPLQRAAESNALVEKLVRSGDIYHPMAWTVAEAHTFLTSAPEYEKAGLVVRMPDWWKSASRRPSVSVKVGDKGPSLVGTDRLLDFDVSLSLGGEPLTDAEQDQILNASDSLVLIRGRWVEVNSERLQDVLDNWTALSISAQAQGIDFSKAMRLLSGTDDAEDELELDERAQWSEVVAGDWLSKTLDDLRRPQASETIEDTGGLKATLRPYQRAGVHWLQTLHRLGIGGCLADDMGLGKTIQVIALLALLKAGDGVDQRTDLLIVPASLIGNWEAELAKFAPHLRPLIAHTSSMSSKALKALSAEDIAGYDLVITTYGTAMRSASIKDPSWRIVVLDEAQAIKNPSAKQTRAIKKIAASWRLALTGTPVENRLSDLWSLFDFLNPGLLGQAKEFGRLCNKMAKHPTDGYAPLRMLVEPYILRRLKTDRTVIADLPDKTEVTAHCLLSKPQAALYKDSVGQMKEALKGSNGIARRGLILSYLMRFKQICNHPSQWLDDGEFSPEASGKFLRLAELAEPIAARQEKLLVFTQFRSMTGPLERHLAQCFGHSGLVLHGGTRVKRRSELVRQFQETSVPFMVLSLKAGGTGLNLTEANHVIHFDRWWNPAVENQATDRAFRIGQKRNVLVHKFVCRGTVEEHIDTLIESKQALSDQVLSAGAETKLTELSNEELVAMVQLDIHRAAIR
jgi:SNF2 family DNA or RNA helicase